jgi:hypothetical protein
MTRTLTLLLLAAAALAAQPLSKADLLKLTDELETAVQTSDWPKAAELSRSLKSAVQDARNQSMAAGGSEFAESVLTWLPSDTETLVVGQQPFAISTQDDTKIPSALEGAQSYVLGLLAAAEKQNLFKNLVGRTVRLAVLGARRFGEETPGYRPPGDQPGPLGMIPYQGCAVYAFTEPVAESILSRPSEDSIMGHRVWTSKGSQNDSHDTETYFVSLLKPDLMLACNHRGFFQEMVSRMSLPRQARALPADLPEWKQLDRTAPLWAICHYPANSGVLAALSPEGKDFGATGVTLEFGLASGAVRARMISKLDPWQDLVENPEFKGAAKSREVAKGVWELSVDGKPDAAMFAVFALMATVGFIVLL